MVLLMLLEFPEAAAKYLPFIGVCVVIFLIAVIWSYIADRKKK